MNDVISTVQKKKLTEMEKQLTKMENQLSDITATLHTQIGYTIPKRVMEYTPLLFSIANMTENLLSIIKSNIQLLREHL